MTPNATVCYKEKCDQSLYWKQARIRGVSNTKGPGKCRTTETLDKIKKTCTDMLAGVPTKHLCVQMLTKSTGIEK